jgi:site-specific DNA-methyltransferase (adenine-specific)
MKGTGYDETVFYPTMKLKDICNLPIQQIANDDCVLFMWATSPLLPEALQVIDAWGFTYRTVAFNWIKTSSKGNYMYNLGRWTMGSSEICLLARKGKPQRIKKNVRQLVVAERTIHSRKPPEVRDRIVELMGDVPRVELFAREITDGWDAWGNQIESTIDI